MTIIVKELKTLREFGIDALTGEAEGIWGFGRILCDLTKNGEQIVREFLGLALEGGFNENWNFGYDNNPHVSSFMLPRSMFEELLIFCHLTRYQYVIRAECTVFKEECLFALHNLEEFEEFKNEYKIVQRYFKHGTAGSRNTHEMTGRTV